MAKALLLLPVALLPAMVRQRAEEPSHLYAVGGKYAILMGPPEVASGAYVREARWTEDGTALLLERYGVGDDVPARALLGARQIENLEGIRPLSRRKEYVAWNLRSGKSRALLSFDPAVADLGGLEPIPRSDRFWGMLTQTAVDPATGTKVSRSHFVILSAGTGALTNLEPAPKGLDANLEFSDQGQGVMVMRDRAANRVAVSVVGPTGRLGSPISLPPRAEFNFGKDGGARVLTVVRDKAGPRIEARRLNLQTGSLGPPMAMPVEEESVEAPSAMTPDVASRAPSVRTARPVPEIGVFEVQMTPKTRGVMLALAPGKPEEMGLVTGDGANPVLSPRKDAVVYLSGGAAFVRRFAKVSLDELRVALAEAEKAKAIARAKQIGTALAMYAMDADEIMSPSGSNLRDVAGPYARNGSVFDGFTYSFGGSYGPEGPGGTELGYIALPGGRVVVFGDGHVGWLPDGP